MNKNIATESREKPAHSIVKPHMTDQQIKHHADISSASGIKRVIFSSAETLAIWRQRIAALK
jgi:hypothetical protein